MHKKSFVLCFLFVLVCSSVLCPQINKENPNSVFTNPLKGQQIRLTNIQNLPNPCGPYIINITITSDSARIIIAKIFWSRNNPIMADSVLMTNTGGNNWTGSIPGNGQIVLYRYYVWAKDSLNRVITIPLGAPPNCYSFMTTADTSKPVITHTPIADIPIGSWPPTVNATVTDDCGIDSVWVRWRINNGIVRYFKLFNTSGNNYSAVFNSMGVAIGDAIHYKIFAQDNSSQHFKDSTPQFNFNIINLIYHCIGTDSVHINYPFNTYWFGNRTQILYTASEIIASGGHFGAITSIGFYVFSTSLQPMNGLTIRMQNTNINSLNGFVNNGWTTSYNYTYTIPGTGLQFITLQTPFLYNGTSNLLIEICFGNTSSTTANIIYGTPAINMAYSEAHDISTACTTFTNPSVQTSRPNICFTIQGMEEVENNNTPVKFNLSQNYPNPFNPVTRISYDIPKQGLVTLNIYDILGREVKELVNDVKALGSYSVDFNATGLSSGIYLYRLETNGFSDVKRMVLMK